MIIFACLAVFVGICGLITAKCNKCFCIGCFAFWSFIVALLLLIAGIILLAVGSASEKLIDDFCEGDASYSSYYANTIDNIDLAMGNATGTYMCTQNCPCPSNLDRTLWTNESRAELYNRTIYAVAPLTDIYAIPFYLAGPNDTVYNTFFDCYNMIKN